jgi:hypothetical protein
VNEHKATWAPKDRPTITRVPQPDPEPEPAEKPTRKKSSAKRAPKLKEN